MTASDDAGPPRLQTRETAFRLGERLQRHLLPLSVGAILSAAAALRLWNLGGKSLWFDEAYSVFIARQPFVEIPRLLRAYDTHPPLHYMFLHVWIALFGDGEVAVRLPSIFASTGAIALTYMFARRLAGVRVALLAALLLAVAPFQVTAAQEARMYPFLMLFGLGASYALWLAAHGGGRRHWMAYCGALTLSLYTHHFAGLLVGVYTVYILGVHKERATTRSWIRWTAVAGLAYLPLVPLVLAQLTTARAWPDIRAPFDLYALTDVLGLFSFGGQLFGMGTYFQRGIIPLQYRPAILLPFLLLAASGVVGLRETRPRAFVLAFCLVPVAIVAAISLRWNIFYERYFSFVLPPFMILLASGVLYLVNVARASARRALFVSLAAYIAAFNGPALATVQRAPQSYDWRGAGAYVTAQARLDDFLLFAPAFTRIPFEYYFRGTQARLGLNPQEVLAIHQQGARGNLRLRTTVAPTLVAAVARDHPRMWMIASSGLGSEVRGQIAQALAPFFRQTDEQTFGLVSVSVWERVSPNRAGDHR